MTTNLGSKIIERESGIKSKAELREQGFKMTPDVVLGWKPIPEPIKDPEVFERVTKLVNDELKSFFRPEFLNRIDEIIVFNHLTRMDIWEICELMIKSIQSRLRDKGIYLVVDLAVQAFLTDEGYDPIYGARPLRRAIMKYLEDTLAEQCLSQTLYTNTKIIVSRKKVEGTLMTYTNELEVEVDFSDVDPNLLEKGDDE
jgi:ATP-dependent Clp protease ATP-binding subunit ClpC